MTKKKVKAYVDDDVQGGDVELLSDQNLVGDLVSPSVDTFFFLWSHIRQRWRLNRRHQLDAEASCTSVKPENSQKQRSSETTHEARSRTGTWLPQRWMSVAWERRGSQAS